MDLVKVTNGQPRLYNYDQFKKDNPRISFPTEVSAGVLEPYGVYRLSFRKPEYNPATQVISRGPIVLEGDRWVEIWEVSDKPIEVIREGMVCSRLQGRLVLGEATCDALDALAADLTTAWAMRQTILHAIQWERNSQSMDELAFLLGYTHDQMDSLFSVAMGVRV
jgi:hypothetical protein